MGSNETLYKSTLRGLLSYMTLWPNVWYCSYSLQHIILSSTLKLHLSLSTSYLSDIGQHIAKQPTEAKVPIVKVHRDILSTALPTRVTPVEYSPMIHDILRRRWIHQAAEGHRTFGYKWTMRRVTCYIC